MFTVKEFLKCEVKPALGCTEPGAVALAVARAKEELPGDVENVVVTVSDSIYKNGVDVGIPGTRGLRGNNVAAALAVLCGRSEYGLEVLKDCAEEDAAKALELLGKGCIKVIPDMERHGVFVEAKIQSGGKTALCRIEGSHTNIVEVLLDDKIRFSTVCPESTNISEQAKSISEEVSRMGFSELVSMVDSMDEEDIDYVLKGVEMNMHIAEYGFSPDHDSGLNLGKTIRKHSGTGFDSDDLSLKIKSYAAAAADARMSGAPLPVMSSAGSGNHGVTAILPVAIFAAHLGADKEETAKAVAFSHLATSYVKSRTGRLTPTCGCTVAAGAGAAAGMTYLKTKDIARAAQAMLIILGNLVGMVCDGAKYTCALKVGTGALEAYHAALLVFDGHYPEPQGLVDETIEKTVNNMVQVSVHGMQNLDRAIIDVISHRFN
ncbi:MAG TPA: L-serine ammonia-lyase, iron-sulfur-dependent, subunit alpha [Synergistales bacterium]|nr:L-serine ammonia-lyase, iron-sulfur-dependent, subunit alpha [Synergistales bacterium]